MLQEQWETIERTLDGLSSQEKREIAVRILQSLDEGEEAERISTQREALRQLCEVVDALPSREQTDGLTNRDHDAVIYTR